MKPKLDYFIGRSVVQVYDNVITLAGDVVIHSLQSFVTNWSEIEGTSLLAVKQDDEDYDVLVFGHSVEGKPPVVIAEIDLIKNEYTIESREYPDAEEPEYVLPPMPVRDAVEEPVTSSKGTEAETEAESG